MAHLLIQDTDTLVGAVLDDAALDVAGNSARQLLSGLRLPTPVTGPDGHCTATGPIEALPTLTGQLVDGPAPDPNRPSDTAFALTMRVNPGTGWITLAGPTVAEPGDAGGMAALPPELVPYNPAAAGDPARLRSGMILRTGAVEELRFSYTNARLLANYPAAQLNVVRESGPAPLPTADTVPVTYGLSRKILLQTPVRLPIPAAPAPLTGNVTCWPFPNRCSPAPGLTPRLATSWFARAATAPASPPTPCSTQPSRRSCCHPPR